MKLLVKILLGVIGLVLALAVVLAIAVAVLFEPENYRPVLAESVQKATGRTLTLEGDLGLDFLPCCAVTLGRAALGNPPGFPAGDFASVDSAALSLKVWPLITRREVEIGTVRLEGLNAALLVRADGAANWEFAAAAEESPAEPAAEGAGVAKLAVEGVEIRGGRVSYRDEQAKTGYLAEAIELRTGELAPGEAVDVSFSARLTDETDGTSATVRLEAEATVDPGLEKVSLARPVVNVEAAGKSIPARTLKATFGAAALDVELKEDTVLQFRGLEGEFELPGYEAVTGDLEGSFTAGDARLGLGKSTELALPKLDAQLTVSGEEIPGETISASVRSGAIALDLDKLWGSVDALSADVNGLGAKVALTADGRIAERGAKLAGTLRLDPLSPRSVLAVLNEPAPETADPAALTRFGGSADWSLGEDALELRQLDFTLDQTRITGSAGVSSFDKPFTRFDLALDTLDADRYLAPEAAVAGGESGGEGGAAPAEEDIPVETLRGLRLDGRVAIGQLVLSKVKLADVSATVRADGGRLRIDPLAARVYGGQYRGAVAIDATGPTAKLSADQQLTALQVGPALAELFETKELTGALSGRIDASGTGNTTDALVKTLAGNMALSLADGAYLGTDLWHEIRSARARIRGDAPPPKPADPQTKFTALELAGNISDGVLRTDRLLAEIPFIRLTGAGALSLVEQTLDYKLQAQVFETPTFEDGSTIKDLTGLTIPLTLKGPVDGPKVGVEITQLATGVATQKLKDRLLKKLGGDEEPPPAPAEGAPPAEGEQAAPTEEPPKEEKPRDMLKRGLRDLLKQ